MRILTLMIFILTRKKQVYNKFKKCTNEKVKCIECDKYINETNLFDHKKQP